jgi:DNA repair exonuclease SbcCD ATPase subunit
VYSIDGVTKMVINNYLPLLNQEISDNLIMLDFPYTLTFNDKFDPTIKDCGQNVPVETLSDGEETRVNLVILCSLYKLIKRKYNDVNLLTVDEVVSSIDTETSAYVISYLKNFAEENNLNVFIVSHTELPLDMFDKIIQVEKINGFSRFEVNKTVA